MSNYGKTSASQMSVESGQGVDRDGTEGGAGLTRRNVLGGTAGLAVGGAAFGVGLLRSLNGARAEATGEPIPIGSMLPLTGSAASDGIAGQQGIELAVEEINAAGGILGRPLQPAFADTKNMSAQEAVTASNRLIDRDGVHGIFCVYNIGPNNAEYEPIADAGIIYMHVNTLIQHQQTVMSDPDRYFGCFMNCAGENFYGVNLLESLKSFRDSGQWTPDNNKIALVVGSLPYSVLIAEEVKKHAESYGFEVAFEEVVSVPTTEWGIVLDKVRDVNPAVIANTHFFAGDLANFQRQFVSNPTNSLVYLQYGALLQSFADIAKEAAPGVLTSTMIGVLPDEMGKAFIKKMRDRHGSGVNYHPASYTYAQLWQWTIAATMAGGSGGPGEYDQNRKVANWLRALPYRSVDGSVAYHPEWQLAMPYPAYQSDPSLGMPSLTYQIKKADGTKGLIFPDPYTDAEFELPSWFS